MPKLLHGIDARRLVVAGGNVEGTLGGHEDGVFLEAFSDLWDSLYDAHTSGCGTLDGADLFHQTGRF